jgi:hypothetical protein
VHGASTSPYLVQQSKNEWLLAMNLETEENLEYPILPPPEPSIHQKIELARHKDAFLRTFIPGDKERLAEMIAFYDESFPGLSTDQLWCCTELLATRPTADKIEDIPAQDDYTHGRILSYAWRELEQEQNDYASDVTIMPVKVTLSWIDKISTTTAAQLADPSLKL